MLTTPRRILHRLIAGALLLVAAPPARAGLLTQYPCPGTVVGPMVWKQLGNDFLENLLFAYGSLWVSDGTRSSVLRLDSSGTELTGLTNIQSPGGLAVGPDGLIYAGFGNSLANSILRTGLAEVVRFDASNPNGTVESYATGLNMPNGMAFAANGDLFVSNDFDYGLVRIPAAAPSAWSEFAHVWGTNGLVIDPAGDNLYAAITFDQRSPIERIPLEDPGAHATAAQLTFGVASLAPAPYTDPDTDAPLLGVKGLDDMTRDGDGILYPVANGTGELLRVDPATGDACLITGGLRNPSSVRIAPEDGLFADGNAATIDFYVVEFSGAIRVVRYRP